MLILSHLIDFFHAEKKKNASTVLYDYVQDNTVLLVERKFLLCFLAPF